MREAETADPFDIRLRIDVKECCIVLVPTLVRGDEKVPSYTKPTKFN